MSRTIDLNCDLGESFGVFRRGDDAAVLPHVSSVNVACGFHAGDPGAMRRAVAAAARHGVAVGAHPGLADLVGFGRREMPVTPEEVYDLVVYQVGALAGFTDAAGIPLRHVRPHGALHAAGCADDEVAAPIAAAVRDLGRGLALYGPPGSALHRAADAAGVPFMREGSVDRAHGSLLPREHAGAALADEGSVVRRALRMALEQRTRAADGTDVAPAVDALRVHGDTPHAVALARAVRAALASAGVRVAAPGAAEWTGDADGPVAATPRP